MLALKDVEAFWDGLTLLTDAVQLAPTDSNANAVFRAIKDFRSSVRAHNRSFANIFDGLRDIEDGVHLLVRGDASAKQMIAIGLGKTKIAIICHRSLQG
ncbi:hypothetical protein [Blastochloris sulfoviridis]|uniref:Uncharacterized protein n=1 Tax=Blastochloris sulfoviridis TaxID=50712 RepID=A0A5M6HTH6_9HYPH|nr:hypothetical protein [Blastochloris sulfoviridis]KAA5599224.1 hypothetical protein F1193_12390 [Blastochloris sulfoviridis]